MNLPLDSLNGIPSREKTVFIHILQEHQWQPAFMHLLWISLLEDTQREMSVERESDEPFAQNQERKRERRGGWDWTSKPKRERECFSLPLATVRGARLQPVVFSPSVSYTHTRFFGSLARLSVGPRRCLSTFFHPKDSLSFFLRHEGCSSRIRIKEKRQRTRNAATEKGRSK